jgi:hypothetical protein
MFNRLKHLFSRQGSMKEQPQGRVTLWDGAATILFPAGYLREVEQDGMFLIFPPGPEVITLRLTLISRRPRQPRALAGFDFVREKALKVGWPFEEIGGKGVANYEDTSEEKGEPLRMVYWLVGAHDQVATVTATVLKRFADDPVVNRTLAIVPGLIDSLEFSNRYEFVETSEGTVQTQVSEVSEPGPQGIVEFGPEQQLWLQTNLLVAREIVTLHQGSEAQVVEPRLLDRAFASWLNGKTLSRTSPQEIANALGAAFGDYLVRTLDMRWVVATDENGTAFALRHEAGETMVFPVQSVLKRIETRQSGFFFDIARVVKSRLENPDTT